MSAEVNGAIPVVAVCVPALSVVTTLYKSAVYLSEFHARMSRATAGIFDSVEFIYVNDGDSAPRSGVSWPAR